MKKIPIDFLGLILFVGILVSSCQKTIDTYASDIIALKASVTALQKRSDSLASALAITNNNLGALSRTVDSIKTQLSNIVIQINQLNIQLTTVNANIVLINAQIVILNQQYADLLARLNAILAQLTITPTSLNTGLVAYYPFTGNAGDSSGNGNHGIITAATLTIDRYNSNSSALNFNSSNQFVRTKNVLQNVINTFSISVWVNPRSTDIIKTEGITGLEGYGTQSVIHPTHGGSWGDQTLNAGVGLNVGSNQIQVIEHTHLFIASPLVYSTSITGWHNITIVYDNHIPSLYLDGKLVRVGLATKIQNVRPSNGYCAFYSNSGFGMSFSPNGSPTGQFVGQFDDVRIYNRVLTQQEITYLSTH